MSPTLNQTATIYSLYVKFTHNTGKRSSKRFFGTEMQIMHELRTALQADESIKEAAVYEQTNDSFLNSFTRRRLLSSRLPRLNKSKYAI